MDIRIETVNVYLNGDTIADETPRLEAMERDAEVDKRLAAVELNFTMLSSAISSMREEITEGILRLATEIRRLRPDNPPKDDPARRTVFVPDPAGFPPPGHPDWDNLEEQLYPAEHGIHEIIGDGTGAPLGPVEDGMEPATGPEGANDHSPRQIPLNAVEAAGPAAGGRHQAPSPDKVIDLTPHEQPWDGKGVIIGNDDRTGIIDQWMLYRELGVQDVASSTSCYSSDIHAYRKGRKKAGQAILERMVNCFNSGTVDKFLAGPPSDMPPAKKDRKITVGDAAGQYSLAGRE